MVGEYTAWALPPVPALCHATLCHPLIYGSTMPSLLIHQAPCIATQNDAGTEWRNASIWVRDGRIEAIVNAADVPPNGCAAPTK